MTLTQIQIFIEIEKVKSFSKAAEKLGITQSAVSHAIKKLEQELDIFLISRERKKLQLTETGTNLLIYFKEIEQQLKNIENEIIAQKNGSKGSVKLGTVWSIANTILPKILNAYKRKYPLVDVTVFEGTELEIEEWLLNSVIDIGVLNTSNKGLNLVKLTEDRFFLATSSKHPLAKKKIINMKELEPYPYIMSKTGCEPLIQALSKLYNTYLNIKYEAREIQTIANMVKENLGVAIIPELAHPKEFQNIKYIPLNTDFKREISLATLKNGRVCSYVDRFMELALSTIKHKNDSLGTYTTYE
ncbi:LysR family transcriptional regulator [Tenacibaculum ovolyticum]|uniref:LysR family transcriptional regulator n=1 Tax=Tenacibaculum ovolyticum TaxID=104270 RepID=UPI003BAA0A3E